jgi:hypothetical protein
MDVIKWGKTRAIESVIVNEDISSENTGSSKSIQYESDIIGTRSTILYDYSHVEYTRETDV